MQIDSKLLASASRSSQLQTGPTQYAVPTFNSSVQSPAALPARLGLTWRNRSLVMPFDVQIFAHVSSAAVMVYQLPQ